MAKKAPAKKAVAKRTGRSAASRDADRRLIALSQEHEVRDWSTKFNCTEAQLRAAVAAVGNSAEKVEAYLKSRPA